MRRPFPVSLTLSLSFTALWLSSTNAWTTTTTTPTVATSFGIPLSRRSHAATTTRLSSTSSSTSSSSTSTSSSSTSSSSSSSSSTVEFAKYHGLGNDFILIDNRHSATPILSPQQASRLCHRNFGIGADGVIFALPTTNPDQFDYQMRIYNADATEPEMCGNGIRCLAQFLKQDCGVPQNEFRIETLAGLMQPVLSTTGSSSSDNNDALVTVDMGPPILPAPLVPTTLTPNFDDNSVVEQTLVDVNGKQWEHVSLVSMGNPHCVIFVDDLEHDVQLNVDGPALEGDVRYFPARTNVEFVQVLSPTHLKMKVWERGAGPTLACGTGACALTVAAMRAQHIPRTLPHQSVRVTLPGGDLFIEWRESDNKVYMTGPATLAFRGNAPIPAADSSSP